MQSSTETFIAHVAAHAGVSPDRAELVTRAVLARIGGSLTPENRQQIADELPPALASAVLAPEALVDEALSAHQRELVASVYRVLAEELSTDVLSALRASLPPRTSELLVPGAPPAAPAPHHGDKLADGKPGSRRPIVDRRR
jgi:uncharacterized protein (DUF2267 family)